MDLVSSEKQYGRYPGRKTLAPNPRHSVLFICNSEDEDRIIGQKGAHWGQEMCDAFYMLQDHGVLVNIATIEGRKISIDPEADGKVCARMRKDEDAIEQLDRCISLRRTEPLRFDGLIYDAVYIFGEILIDLHDIPVIRCMFSLFIP